jgi:rhamnulose-1-phosphate aldolase
VQGTVKANSDMWIKGWDERNGGNVSLRLLDEDTAGYADQLNPLEPRPIGESIPAPAGGEECRA